MISLWLFSGKSETRHHRNEFLSSILHGSDISFYDSHLQCRSLSNHLSKLPHARPFAKRHVSKLARDIDHGVYSASESHVRSVTQEHRNYVEIHQKEKVNFLTIAAGDPKLGDSSTSQSRI
ncbi:hypothetical protein AVEN_35504-1 [Araneus ventricosus]|uniref:Uncharacterized protein n=1 Tax=Araneus ventricosus TaxID=182803 RepID=A0A4Y2REZ9_ARAVE|nr:hypothetical protein AVEN_35504-1 [Araneus ventricosus]